MAFAFRSPYGSDVEERMKAFYQTLSEKDRRRYVAVEAHRLGHGGIRYVAHVFGGSSRTIERGLVELSALPQDPAVGRAAVGKNDRLRPSTRTELESGARRSHRGRPR